VPTQPEILVILLLLLLIFFSGRLRQLGDGLARLCGVKPDPAAKTAGAPGSEESGSSIET